MEIANINSIFPVELLHIVFAKLSSSDLKSALLVCRHWWRIGEHHKFWSWVTLQVTQNNLSVMPAVLTTDRFKGVEELYVREVSEALLQAIDLHPGVKVLNLNHCNVTSAESRQLAKIVSKMEEVDFEEAQLTAQQNQAIFNLVSSESNLKRLFMPRSDLKSVDPDTLARVVSNLKFVDINYAEMTSLQCQKIFQFAESGSKLVRLHIGEINLSAVNPETLARVVSQLREVILNDTRLTKPQCEKIIEFAFTAARLKLLFISENDLSTVDPHSLSIVVSRLDLVSLSWTNLTPRQCEEIFEVATSASSKLYEMDIIQVDLSSVNEKNLAEVISKLNWVHLSYAKLTIEQCQEIFMHLSQDSKMEDLKMSNNDLSDVDPEDMAIAISKLKSLEVWDAKIDSQQCKQIFEMLSNDCELNYLNMAHNDLQEVDPEDLTRIISKIQKVNLRGTHLTTRQSEDIFQLVAGESKIEKLEMSYNDLSSVNAELLAKASAKLEKIDLSNTGLTGKQCQEIFNWLTKDNNINSLKKLVMYGNDMGIVDLEAIAKVSAKLTLKM